MRQQTPHDRAAWRKVEPSQTMKRDAEAVQTHLNRGSCSLGNPVDSTTVTRVLVGLGHPGLGVCGGGCIPLSLKSTGQHLTATVGFSGPGRTATGLQERCRTALTAIPTASVPAHPTSGTAHEQR